MQRWCPEAFTSEGVILGRSPGAATAFRQEAPAAANQAADGAAGARFRKESGFATTEALMAHLTAEERATVFELVEIDVAQRYRGREQELQQEFERRLEEIRRDSLAWAESFAALMEQELREVAKGAVALARQLAERIVRARVEIDPEVLTRVIENTLFRIQGSHLLTVTVNPEDAARLAGAPELRERLHIGKILSDRRIAAGGCLVESGGREWDATLQGQLDALGELIQEMVCSDPQDGPATEPLPEGADGAVPVE